MHQRNVDVVAIIGQRRGSSKPAREAYILEPGVIRKALCMRQVRGVKLAALKGDLGVRGGEQHQGEALSEPQLQHASRLQAKTGR